ncbi:hypothetical protein L0Y46_02460, partial [bacterium]|nr:hypothetical protein [bacterium]
MLYGRSIRTALPLPSVSGDFQATIRQWRSSGGSRACSKTLDYCEFMLRAANGGSERLKISTIFFA